MGLRDNRVWLVGRLVLRRVRAERVGGVEIPIVPPSAEVEGALSRRRRALRRFPAGIARRAGRWRAGRVG